MEVEETENWTMRTGNKVTPELFLYVNTDHKQCYNSAWQYKTIPINRSMTTFEELQSYLRNCWTQNIVAFLLSKINSNEIQ